MPLFGKIVSLVLMVFINDDKVAAGEVFINVEIGASNYNSPIFRQTKYEFRVNGINPNSNPTENGTSIGTAIGKVTATDSDFGSYGEIRYSCQNDLGITIDRYTERLSLRRQQNNREIAPHNNLTKSFFGILLGFVRNSYHFVRIS